ncbi:MAG: type I glyceraldehyde-3-phosphate dehydrogenase [Holosporaceae bacterium]|jgi:glyceraldehyde 3-phosphate dehydrogenase|nr:type I glyceraldehyde-3-phosphate dehydrogenase [Holosporaceae bacterium]
MRAAINGFGRIGRLTLRAFTEFSNEYGFEIVLVNDPQCVDSALHLFKYDSIHGRFNEEVQKISDDEFELNGKRLKYISERRPEKISWSDLGVDFIFECTGAFKSKESCGLHLKSGAKKVLISCPANDADNTIVYGVNHDSLQATDAVVSCASCTTNCLAHVVKALRDEIGIANGFATTVHSYTPDQRLTDASHKDPRRARAAAGSMIPTSTGATKAIEKIFPELKGKLSGLSVRVPTPNVSMIDFTFTASKKITEDDIRRAFIKYASAAPKDVFACVDEPLVSIDFNHSPQSAIVDLPLIKVVDETIGHVVAWYDNEWGFSKRMLDLAREMSL